jgi:hypothetical protein
MPALALAMFYYKNIGYDSGKVTDSYFCIYMGRIFCVDNHEQTAAMDLMGSRLVAFDVTISAFA